MRKILALLLTAALLMTTSASVFAEEKLWYEDGETIGKPDTSDWFVWNWPDDSEAYGTAIDASFLNEKPAGKHGRVVVNGDEFAFEDGTPFHVWGINMGTQSNFMYKKEDQVKLADRLARCGINAVRFHGWGASGYDNIFGEGATHTATKVDPVQLDKIHYFMSLLKERGIYWYVDVFVRRNYIPDDVLPDVRYEGFTENRFFADDVINGIQYVLKQFLGSVNPYTGMTVAEDPALMAISLSNELTILNGNVSDPYDNATLESMFNYWLIDKYGTREKLSKAWNEEGKQGLSEDENCENGTVDLMGDGSEQIIPYYEQMNYSSERYNDAVRFLCDVQTNYYDKMSDFLRNELGTKCLITPCDMGNSYNHNLVLTSLIDNYDFMSGHMYKAHPLGFAYGAGTRLTGWTSTAQTLGSELWRVPPWSNNYNQPYIMGEWDSVAPGPYAAEGVITHSVISRYQNWNSLYFSSLSKTQFTENEGHDEFFASVQCGDISSVLPLASALFLRGDIKRAEKSYYMTNNREENFQKSSFGQVPTGLNDIWMYLKTGMYFEDNEKGEEYTPTPEALDEAYKKYENNEIESDEINWNRRSGIFKVETPYANVALGLIGYKKIDFEYSTIELENYTAIVGISSATKETLKDSDRLLLTTVTRSRNTGQEFSDDHYTMEAAGSGPQLMEPVIADITIKTGADENIEVYALDSSGRRTETLEVTRDKNGYSKFRADGKKYKAVHYEIVK